MAFVFLAIMNRLKMYFGIQLKKTKLSKGILLVRILTGLCFVIIGFWLGKNQVLPTIISNWLNNFGETGEFSTPLLANFPYI